jgi:hypothetical protein
MKNRPNQKVRAEEGEGVDTLAVQSFEILAHVAGEAFDGCARHEFSAFIKHGNL